MKPTYNCQYWHLPSNKILFLCEESYNCLVIAVDTCNERQKYRVKKENGLKELGTCSNFIIVQFGTIVFVIPF